MKARRIQLGCGPWRIPGWDNYDIDVDIRKSLPFPSECAEFILAEHVIEHVPFADGYRFLFDCWRVLQPGGILRISFPDVTRVTDEMSKLYASHLRRFGRAISTKRDVVRSILTDWGHVSCWTRDSACLTLESLHFTRITQYSHGESHTPALVGIDQHDKSVGLELAIAESTILEAVKL